MSRKKKGLLIALIAFGAVGFGYALHDDDNNNAEGSPFTPGS